MRKLVLALAAGVSLAMISWQAQAVPLAAAKQVYKTSHTTLVAQGCGRGWHWSYALRRCVP